MKKKRFFVAALTLLAAATSFAMHTPFHMRQHARSAAQRISAHLPGQQRGAAPRHGGARVERQTQSHRPWHQISERFGGRRGGEQRTGEQRAPQQCDQALGPELPLETYQQAVAHPIPGPRTHMDYPVREGNEVAFLPNQASLYHRVNLIKYAKCSVYYQTFAMENDPTTDAIVDALVEKKRQGMDVKVILDPKIQGLTLLAPKQSVKDTMYPIQKLKQAGIPVYGGTDRKREVIKGFGSSDRKGPVQEISMIRHEKLLLVDSHPSCVARGERPYAIAGNNNTGAKYFGVLNPQRDHFVSTDFLIRGPVVLDMQTSFDRNLADMQAFYGVQTMPAGHRDLKVGPFEPEEHGRLREVLAGHFDGENAPYLRPTYYPASMRFVHSRPRKGQMAKRGTNPIINAYLEGIDQAQAGEEVLINNSFFIPHQALKDAVVRAARRGVRVKILTNSIELMPRSEMPVELATWDYYDLLAPFQSPELQHLAPEIYEYKGRPPGQPKEHLVKGYNQNKYMLVGRNLSFSGSSNLDPKSMNQSAEDIVILDSEPMTDIMRDHFERMLPFSQRINFQEVQAYRKKKSRNPLFRIKHKFIRPFN